MNKETDWVKEINRCCDGKKGKIRHLVENQSEGEWQYRFMTRLQNRITERMEVFSIN